MDERRLSRRAALRGAASGSAVIALSGCLDSLPIVGSPPAPEVAPMPAETNLFVTVDFQTLLNDDGYRQLANAAIPVTDVDSVLDLAEERTGLDPTALRRSTAFHTVSAEQEEPISGAIFDTGWSLAAIRSAFDTQGYTVTESTIGGGDAIAVENPAVTLVSFPSQSDRYVIGTEAGVRAVLDVAREDGAKTVGANFRRAYGRTKEGAIRFAANIGPMAEVVQNVVAQQANLISKDVIESIRHIGGSLYATDDQQYGIQFRFSMTDGSAASDMKQFAQAVHGYANKYTNDQALLELLGDFEETRNGTRVTMTYEGQPADMEPLIEIFGQQLTGVLLNSALVQGDS